MSVRPEPPMRRLARLESKITKLGLYLGAPLEKDSPVPDPKLAHIGYNPDDDEPYIEIVSLHVTMYDLTRLYQQIETRKPVDVRMRGQWIATIGEPREV